MISHNKVTQATNLIMKVKREEAWKHFITLVKSGELDDPELFNAAFRFTYPFLSMGKSNRTEIESIAGRINRELASTPEMLDLFDSLPSQITIYRGGSVKEYESGLLGVSWSLERGVAEYFAFFNYYGTEPHIVMSASINKEDVLAMFDAYDECEVLCLVDPSCVKIETDCPSNLLDKYIERHHKHSEELGDNSIEVLRKGLTQNNQKGVNNMET